MTLKTIADVDGIFGIEDAVTFYNSISSMLDRYKRTTRKDSEKLLYIVMGLNHLREWIAPSYDPKTMSPSAPEEFFYEKIFSHPPFKILKSICELSKHQAATASITTGVGYAELPMCDWRSLSEVKN